MSKDHVRKDAVIVSAVRTPVGKFQGTLAALSASDLGAVAICAAVESTDGCASSGYDDGVVSILMIGHCDCFLLLP